MERIKLTLSGKFMGARDDMVEQYIGDVVSAGFINPFYQREIVLNEEAAVELSRRGANTVHLKSIRSFAPRSGAGSRTMTFLTELADDLGIDLALSPVPYGTKYLSKEQLVKFYKKFGFKKVGSGEMVRTAEGGQGDAEVSNPQDVYATAKKAWAKYIKLPPVEDDGSVLSPKHCDTGVCTESAFWIKCHYFPDAVLMGYAHSDNRKAVVGEVEGGHDFLIVEDRYLIDFWYKDIYEPSAPLLYDLLNKTDAAEVRRLYGSPKAWGIIEVECR